MNMRKTIGKLIAGLLIVATAVCVLPATKANASVAPDMPILQTITEQMPDYEREEYMELFMGTYLQERYSQMMYFYEDNLYDTTKEMHEITQLIAESEGQPIQARYLIRLQFLQAKYDELMISYNNTMYELEHYYD